MERQEARIIFKKVQSYFPNFDRDRDPEIAKNWLDRLEEGDFKKTERQLNRYSEKNPFPPSLADILVIEPGPVRSESFDLEEAREAVKREKADPEKAARREAAVKKLERMLEGWADADE